MRSTVYVYDNNGNVLSIGGKATSTWDYANRLVSMSQGATTTTYGYDHEGQRVTYAVNGNATTYVNKLFNIEAVGATTGTTTHIFLGDDMVATIEKKGTTTTTYYHHTDHLSGASVTTTTGGDVAEITDYYPYGTIRYSDSSQGFSEQRKFTGHELDTDTNLTYMGARYYEGSTGRFRSVDPVFSNLGVNSKQDAQFLVDPQQLNSYSYSRNNPLRFVDPDGKTIKEAFENSIAASLDFIENTVVGSVNAVFHPVQTVKNIPQIPGQLVQQTKDIQAGLLSGDDAQRSYALTSGLLLVGSLVAPEGNFRKLSSGDSGFVRQVGDLVAEHSFGKHVLGIGNRNGKEFGSLIQNKTQLSEYVQGVIKNSSDIRQLDNGRTAFWDNRLESVVIFNSKDPTRSTVYRPWDGKRGFTKLK